mmetsp:Transcript_20433/g.64246  ORF Transcript_20433/g.64246 Transcript_20433/m.64246 type:complete len:277 (+) Transcript_20433:155-985(+)|eukprot:CAMPEP_0197395384 /NCGR_PEP_ID=MMETSP1165-20131217/6923_1 /TAXON_ID=284809 /ORGANISM="Chrysocystis fragilis, Strain CCMP3189" /LENGTH=276 /DNA_ID=CAMNT_0042921145 /DNA_START=145 /DNA_END=975 /DNA_ORIENTATION=+
MGEWPVDAEGSATASLEAEEGRREANEAADTAVGRSEEAQRAGSVTPEEEIERRRSLESASLLSDDEDPASGSGPGGSGARRGSDASSPEAHKLESGRWSMAEHKRFVEGLQKFGRRKWIRIAEHVGTRTVIQVRSHAQKYFKKLRKEEDDPRPFEPPFARSKPLSPGAPLAAVVPPSGFLAFSPWLPPPFAPKQQQQPEPTGGLALLTAAASILDKSRTAQRKDDDAPAAPLVEPPQLDTFQTRRRSLSDLIDAAPDDRRRSRQRRDHQQSTLVF